MSHHKKVHLFFLFKVSQFTFLCDSMTTAQTPLVRTLDVPLRIYDVLTGEYVEKTVRFDAKKSRTGDWYDLTLEAQRLGKRQNHSNEWFLGRQYLEHDNPKAERDFIEGPLEWTGTVLDYDREEIQEGLILNPDKSIASVGTRLGRKEGILLPDKSGYVKDFHQKYMGTMSQIWGVEDPMRGLPDYAYLYVTPNGFRPVVRGGWFLLRRDYRRVSANAGCAAADRRFAARFVSDTAPEPMQAKEAE